MMKLNSKQKKAFTLIELLIIIAIIGILFIVLISKVDFATDKAKASGVQTDFRSFQAAFETVSKENAGFNTFGWDTGDSNGNRIRDSFDEGDANQDGIYQEGETWIGRKVYTETWTGCYTLINPGNASDYSAIFDLETAINKNLDPKLHIMIANDGVITMANGLKDPWSTQYHGRYITNASADAAAKWNVDASMTGFAGDNMDRGAILIYSNGANQKFGTKVKIEGGVVTATVSQIDANTPDNNKMGADDYVLAVVYSYTNGYGETMAPTWGFSQNNKPATGNSGSISNVENQEGDLALQPGLYATGTQTLIRTWDELIANNYFEVKNGVLSIKFVEPTNLPAINEFGFYFGQPYTVYYNGMYSDTLIFYADGSFRVYYEDSYSDEPAGTLTYSSNGIYWSGESEPWLVIRDSKTIVEGEDVLFLLGSCINTGSLTGDLIIKSNIGITSIGNIFAGSNLSSIVIPNGVTNIGDSAFQDCSTLCNVVLPNTLITISNNAFHNCTSLTNITIPDSVTTIGDQAFYNSNLKNVIIPDKITYIGQYAFAQTKISEIVIPNGITTLKWAVFLACDNLVTVTIPETVTKFESEVFHYCSKLIEINFTGTKTQWSSITKSNPWKTNTGTFTVYCTDGNIAKSDS